MVFLDAIQMLALLGLTVYHFYYKNKIQEEVDNSTITMEDYSIEVHRAAPGCHGGERSSAL